MVSRHFWSLYSLLAEAHCRLHESCDLPSTNKTGILLICGILSIEEKQFLRTIEKADEFGGEKDELVLAVEFVGGGPPSSYNCVGQRSVANGILARMR